jgi:hypothetical protein
LAFGVDTWQSTGQKHALPVTAAELIAKEVLGTVVAPFFPMHLREVLAKGGGTSKSFQRTCCRTSGSRASVLQLARWPRISRKRLVSISGVIEGAAAQPV